jgi:fructokinase
MLPNGHRLGGATTNFAVLSARLGEYSSLVSCVGDDELGRDAMGRLDALAKDASLSLAGVQTSDSLPTGTVSVTLDEEGRPKYVINSPVAWDAISLTPELIELAGSAAVIYFGTLAQRDERSRTSMRTLVEAAGPECTRMCDLNLRMPFCTEEVLRWSIGHADVLKISDEELSEVGHMLGSAAISRGLAGAVDSASLSEAAVRCASELLRITPQCKLVAITLGPHGSLLMDREGSFRHSGYVVKVVDTIGAGDAFTAGLVHAYLQGATLAGISAVANRCGSFVASQSGATPEIPEEVKTEIRGIIEAGS